MVGLSCVYFLALPCDGQWCRGVQSNPSNPPWLRTWYVTYLVISTHMYTCSDTLLNTYKTKHQTENELQIRTHDNRLPYPNNTHMYTHVPVLCLQPHVNSYFFNNWCLVLSHLACIYVFTCVCVCVCVRVYTMGVCSTVCVCKKAFHLVCIHVYVCWVPVSATT